MNEWREKKEKRERKWIYQSINRSIKCLCMIRDFGNEKIEWKILIIKNELKNNNKHNKTKNTCSEIRSPPHIHTRFLIIKIKNNDDHHYCRLVSSSHPFSLSLSLLQVRIRYLYIFIYSDVPRLVRSIDLWLDSTTLDTATLSQMLLSLASYCVLVSR